MSVLTEVGASISAWPALMGLSVPIVVATVLALAIVGGLLYMFARRGSR